MESLYAFICDYAQSTGNKVSALGVGFDTIYAPTVPTTHRQFFLVAKLSADAAEAGMKNVTINIIDADGNDIIPAVVGQLNIPRPSGPTTTANLLIGFDNVLFNDYGDYSIHMVLDGHTLVRIPMSIAKPPTTT